MLTGLWDSKDILNSRKTVLKIIWSMKTTWHEYMEGPLSRLWAPDLWQYFQKVLEKKVFKAIFITIKICSASNIIWCGWISTLEVEINLGHAHKTRFWYHLGVFSKFSDQHPRHFYRGVRPPPPPGLVWSHSKDLYLEGAKLFQTKSQ